jgi:hypothetical protein
VQVKDLQVFETVLQKPLTLFKLKYMGKAKSTRKNTKKTTPASGMVSKTTGPSGMMNKAPGAMNNKNFSSAKKGGGFSVTPRKAS